MTNEIFSKIAQQLSEKGFTIASSDFTRPWGGFFVIDESQTQKFIETYFPSLPANSLLQGARLSPKILVVGPQKRLSWQYHFRRAEVWRVVDGPIAVAQSDTDEQTEPKTYQNGELITLKQGERHRLIGLDKWGVVAEIWQHTNADHPSDESDIVRVQDDFSR
ncbi:phosphoheptose isomerase [Cytophagaceae bacterium YF14B1]|uniref:Phosphoheptose isomerase n=1 Tax=Xanthocytophaga flava TaxID=3048013 RepID=A0AAE3U958_9BACT|nr:phosphoheptose isomerase [Xanthocytophaga flavus]MDJ1483347.1 phosphoheptose isomerase [Xanthocytophaga flavus]